MIGTKVINSINRNIVECKVMQNCIGGWERESINRNIVECKESIPADRI